MPRKLCGYHCKVKIRAEREAKAKLTGEKVDENKKEPKWPKLAPIEFESDSMYGKKCKQEDLVKKTDAIKGVGMKQMTSFSQCHSQNFKPNAN